MTMPKSMNRLSGTRLSGTGQICNRLSGTRLSGTDSCNCQYCWFGL